MKKHTSNIFTVSQIKKNCIYIVFVFLFVFNYDSFAQIVNIPDAAFKSELVSNAAINTNGDGEIQVSEAVAFTGQIQLLNPTISDLTGLEAFINIDTLNIDGIYNLTNTNLDLTANPAIRCLFVGGCSLTGLNVSTCDSLDLLFAQTNNLTSLDLSHNHLLTRVYANNNPALTSINLTGDTLITGLHLNNDLLTSIDLSTLHSLETFEIPNNPITNLDLSHNPALTDVYCFATNVTTLDFSHNPLLGTLQCQNNSFLTSVNLQRGFVANIYLQATNCPNLTCVQVDSVGFAVTFWSTNFDPGVNFSTSCPAFLCNVNIPDATFKTLLLSNPLINTNGDNEIQCSEAINYTGEIKVINPAITDLTGLEAFINIDSLNLNQLNLTNTNLDLTTNTALKVLYCPIMYLTTLDISTCTQLRSVNIVHSNLNSVALSNKPYLTDFNCAWNNISSLDLSHNNALTNINCYHNSLTNINLTNDSLVIDLDLGYNFLPTVDLSTLTHLQGFGMIYNPVITQIDLSHNYDLATLYIIYDSLLNSLNLKNGHNTSISSLNIQATNNPVLTCVEVDSVAYSVANWGNSFDPGANFSTNCFSGVGIDELKNNSAVQLYPNPANGNINIHISNASYNEVLFEMYDATGKNVFSKLSKINSDDATIKTSIEQYNEGIYLVRLTSNHQLIYSSRLIKE